jgi:Mn2+/Fe2+ NRAMP family transporter
MIITALFACSILAVSILAWLFRQRIAQHLPSKETLTTTMLFAAVALLLVVVLLPDILLLVYTLNIMPHSLRIVLALAAATMVCVGCSKQTPEPAKPAVIHWQGQDGGYEDTTAVPPKAATQ